MSRNDLPLIAFREWLRQLRQYGGAVCVAAAGNSGIAQAKLAGRLLRGGRPSARSAATGAAGPRSAISAPWVDVYAPGRDLVNAYRDRQRTRATSLRMPGQIRHFYGMAKWSGTSFSTPIVTGLIAARMSRTGENARQAAAALLAEARAQAIPGVGPVLLPCCHESRAPRPPDECGCRNLRHRPGAC